MTFLYKELTNSILKCAYKIHSALGPGLLESAYEECLHYELEKTGLLVIKQKPMPWFMKKGNLIWDTGLICLLNVKSLSRSKLLIL